MNVMRRTLPSFFLASGFCLLAVSFDASSARAENSDLTTRHGLSQLEFDRRVLGSAVDRSAKAPELVDPEEVIRKMNAVTKAPVAPVAPAKTAPAGTPPPSQARAKLADLPVKGIVALTKTTPDHIFMTPRLKGPEADANDSARISTRSVWHLYGAKNCKDVEDPRGLCEKTKTLQEFMSRYSGSDDFYSSLCQEQCAEPGTSSKLVSLAFKDSRGGAFKFAANGNSCGYLLERKKDRQQWLALEVSSYSCACLPNATCE